MILDEKGRPFGTGDLALDVEPKVLTAWLTPVFESWRTEQRSAPRTPPVEALAHRFRARFGRPLTRRDLQAVRACWRELRRTLGPGGGTGYVEPSLSEQWRRICGP